MPSRRDHSLEFWLARRQRRRLLTAWNGLWDALAEVPRNQKLAEQHRAKMPPGGLAWPFWEVVLKEVEPAPEGRVFLDTTGLVPELRMSA